MQSRRLSKYSAVKYGWEWVTWQKIRKKNAKLGHDKLRDERFTDRIETQMRIECFWGSNGWRQGKNPKINESIYLNRIVSLIPVALMSMPAL